MKRDKSFGANFSRRTLMTSAMAGAFTVAAHPAAAQRCPPIPPARVKGPLVWMNMDQQDVDEAQTRTFMHSTPKTFLSAKQRQEIARLVVGKPMQVPSGQPRSNSRYHQTKRANAPVMIFIHGGSWRSGRSADFAVYAEPFVKAGANFVAIDFTNVRETNGDIFPMVNQCRRAVSWTYRNAASFGGNADQIYLCSRSSGSHLAGCVVTTEWNEQGLPLNILKGGVFGSGMYDLKPVRLSLRSKFVRFTNEMEEQLSPQRNIDRIYTPLTLAVGSLETPEFQRQAGTSRLPSRPLASLFG